MIDWVDGAPGTGTEGELAAVAGQARRLFDRIRRAALERTRPDGTTHDTYVRELLEAMGAGDFSLCALLQIGGPLQTAALEWLNSTKGLYMGVEAVVRIRNKGGEPVFYCGQAVQVTSPRYRLRAAVATVNRKPVTEFRRRYARIAPGAVADVPVGKAVTLLHQHCALAYPPERQGLRSGPLSDALREVGGYVRVIGDSPVEWLCGPQAAETTTKAPPRRPRAEEP